MSFNDLPVSRDDGRAFRHKSAHQPPADQTGSAGDKNSAASHMPAEAG
jgi:hypothetical protein